MTVEPLFDGHGRQIQDLRVSVTDRCNFRCQYCMPAEGLPWLNRSEVLTFEEIERLVRLFVAMGIEDVRLTGGEPLVRRDFPPLVSMLSRVDGLQDLSLPTNRHPLQRGAAVPPGGRPRRNCPRPSPRGGRGGAPARRRGACPRGGGGGAGPVPHPGRGSLAGRTAPASAGNPGATGPRPSPPPGTPPAWSR